MVLQNYEFFCEFFSTKKKFVKFEFSIYGWLRHSEADGSVMPSNVSWRRTAADETMEWGAGRYRQTEWHGGDV